MQSRQARHAAAPPPLAASTVLLFAGAAVLLLASLWIVVAARRGNNPTPTQTQPIVIVATPSATPSLPTVVPSSPAITPPSPTTAPPTAATPATPPLSTATPAPRLPTPTARQPNASLNGCSLVLPPGFREEQAGYYPATDASGYVALDRFEPPASQGPLSDLTATFVQTTISHAVRDFRQTASAASGDGYRVDFTATVAGRPGKGSFYVKRFGTAACGVTLFLLDGAVLQTPTVLDLLILSLQGPSR